MNTINNKLQICKETRKIAADTLKISLQKLLSQNKPVSETTFRDTWLLELRKHKEIFPDGWYTPPPNGIGVLFATDKNFERIEFKTLRKEKYWPKENIFLDTTRGFVMFYCSPFDRKTGIIGDFGMNVYFGKNQKIQQELKKYFGTIEEIASYSKVGMKLSDIHNYAKKTLSKNGFTNEWWISTTDPTGTNYGHTIPAIDFSWTLEAERALKNNNWQQKITFINKSRKFINASEQTIINSDSAITIEPRVNVTNHSEMPTMYFHTILLFKENGEKELLTDFDEIFKLTKMSYMLN